MGDLGVLAAFVIGFTGTYGVAVCGKMLSGVWALSGH